MNFQNTEQLLQLQSEIEGYERFIAFSSEKRELLTKHFSAAVEDFAQLLANRTLKDITASLVGQPQEEKQITSFGIDLTNEILEIASEAMDAPMELLKGEVCVVSEAASGNPLDIMARIKNMLSDDSLHIPLSQEDKEKLFKALDSFMQEKSNIGLEAALSDEKYLKFSDAEIQAFRKIEAEYKKIEVCDNTIKKATLSFYEAKMELYEISKSLAGTVDSKFKASFAQIAEKVFDKTLDTLKFSDMVIEGLAYGTTMAVLTPYSAIKVAGYKAPILEVEALICKSLLENVSVASELEMYPDTIVQCAEKAFNEKPGILQKAKMALSFIKHDFLTAYHLSINALKQFEYDNTSDDLEKLKTNKQGIISAAREDIMFFKSYVKILEKGIADIEQKMRVIEDKAEINHELARTEPYLSLVAKRSEFTQQIEKVQDLIQSVIHETAQKIGSLNIEIKKAEIKLAECEVKMTNNGKALVENMNSRLATRYNLEKAKPVKKATEIEQD